MPFLTKSELISFTRLHNIYLSKGRGQCFLIDRNVKNKIIQAAKLDADQDIILEIGPGLGVLTNDLIEGSKQLFLIELDKKPARILYEEFKKKYDTLFIEGLDARDWENSTKINLIRANALKISWPPVNKIVSNVPYQISGPLLFKMIETWNYSSVTLLVQKEFAERLVAKPNTKQYSRLSAAIGLFLNVEILSNVSPNAFFPAPKVTSSIIYLTQKENFKTKKILKIEQDLYLKFLEGIFPYKNKAIRKAIIHFFENFGEYKKILPFLFEIVQPSLYSDLLKRKVRSFSSEELINFIRFGISGDISTLPPEVQNFS